MSAIKETFFHGELKVEVKRERLDSRFMHIDVFHPNTFGAKGKFAGALEMDCQTGTLNWYDPEKDESVRLFEGGEPNRCVMCGTQIETGDLCKRCHDFDKGHRWNGSYLVWTRHDSVRAQVEGWDVFDAGAHGHEIERCDDSISFAGANFPDDDAAIDYVVERAKAGSKMHQRALAIHETGVCHYVAIVEAVGGAYFLGPRYVPPVWYERNPGERPCPACDGDYVLLWVQSDMNQGHATQLEWDDGSILEVEMDRIDEDVKAEAERAKGKLLALVQSGLETFPPEPPCQCQKGGTK